MVINLKLEKAKAKCDKIKKQYIKSNFDVFLSGLRVVKACKIQTEIDFVKIDLFF